MRRTIVTAAVFTLALTAPAAAAPPHTLSLHRARTAIRPFAAWVIQREAQYEITVDHCTRTSPRRMWCIVADHQSPTCVYTERWVAHLSYDGRHVSVMPALNWAVTVPGYPSDCGTISVTPVAGDPTYDPGA